MLVDLEVHSTMAKFGKQLDLYRFVSRCQEKNFVSGVKVTGTLGTLANAESLGYG